MTPRLRLYHFRVSHYNEKVRWALDYKGLPHERVALVPGFHVPKARWVSGQNRLPVLRIDDRVVIGSAAIVEAIDELRPDPPLFPDELNERRRALAIQGYFDDEVAPELRRLFWSAYWHEPALAARMATDGFSVATRAAWRAAFPALRPVFAANLGMGRAALAHARQRLVGHFERLESALGDARYIVGGRFGVADLAVASILAAIVRPLEFPYPLPEPWPAALRELHDSVAQRPGFAWVQRMYALHRGVSSEVAAR